MERRRLERGIVTQRRLQGIFDGIRFLCIREWHWCVEGRYVNFRETFRPASDSYGLDICSRAYLYVLRENFEQAVFLFSLFFSIYKRLLFFDLQLEWILAIAGNS